MKMEQEFKSIIEVYAKDINDLKDIKFDELRKLYDNHIIIDLYKLYDKIDLNSNYPHIIQPQIELLHKASTVLIKLNTSFFYHFSTSHKQNHKKNIIHTYCESSSIHLNKIENTLNKLLAELNQIYAEKSLQKANKSILLGIASIILAIGTTALSYTFSIPSNKSKKQVSLSTVSSNNSMLDSIPRQDSLNSNHSNKILDHHFQEKN